MEAFAYQVTSREEARWLGQIHYFTGKPCRRGHSSNRLVRTANCVACQSEFRIQNRERINRYSREHWATLTPEKKREKNKWSREYLSRKPLAKLLFGARDRAKQQGVPFNLTSADISIPDVCPVLGIPLKRGNGKLHDGSPSLDRLIPDLGYVANNVRVISHRANRIKQNASIEELESVVRWMRAEIG